MQQVPHYIKLYGTFLTAQIGGAKKIGEKEPRDEGEDKKSGQIMSLVELWDIWT